MVNNAATVEALILTALDARRRKVVETVANHMIGKCNMNGDKSLVVNRIIKPVT